MPIFRKHHSVNLFHNSMRYVKISEEEYVIPGGDMKDLDTKQPDSYSKITKVVIIVLVLLISMWMASSMIMTKYGKNNGEIETETSESIESVDSSVSSESEAVSSEQASETNEKSESAVEGSSVAAEQEEESTED